MRFSELVEHVSKKPIPPWKKHLLVEVTVTDEEGEDVEVSHCVSEFAESAECCASGAVHHRAHLNGVMFASTGPRWWAMGRGYGVAGAGIVCD